jgi:hypothetical protein
MEMFENFHKGKLNLSRLNLGLISLINIKQFRLICSHGVDYI